MIGPETILAIIAFSLWGWATLVVAAAALAAAAGYWLIGLYLGLRD